MGILSMDDVHRDRWEQPLQLTVAADREEGTVKVASCPAEGHRRIAVLRRVEFGQRVVEHCGMLRGIG